ncbi:MAG: hypothetical protein ACRDZN_06365 [Acidimicrobiales bacterium]
MGSNAWHDPPRAKRTEAADGTVSVTGKASNGEGSIYFVASKGTYRAAWVDPATGRRRTVSAATKAQAAQRMAEAQEGTNRETHAGHPRS